MGRWTGQIYRLKENRTLSVITAYCPCQQTYSAIAKSSLTVNKQQVLLQLEDTGMITSPRKVFMEDLITLIKGLERDPLMMIILMIDANTSIDETSSPLQTLFTESSLVDAFHQITGTPCTLPTYTRGSKRIDYIFTSQSLVSYINKAGYLAFYKANESDHRGMFIDLDDNLLDNKVELHCPPRRNIGYSSPAKTIYQYKHKQYIHQQFNIHRIYTRAAALYALSELHPITPGQLISINNLDKQVTEILLAAEKHVRIYGIGYV
jgi:hypothetical protein